MKTMPEGVMLMISRLNDDALNVSIAGESFELEPCMWGTLLGDLFKNLVRGYVMAGESSEEELVKVMMQGFVTELQDQGDGDIVSQIPIVTLHGARDDN